MLQQKCRERNMKNTLYFLCFHHKHVISGVSFIHGRGKVFNPLKIFTPKRWKSQENGDFEGSEKKNLLLSKKGWERWWNYKFCTTWRRWWEEENAVFLLFVDRRWKYQGKWWREWKVLSRIFVWNKKNICTVKNTEHVLHSSLSSSRTVRFSTFGYLCKCAIVMLHFPSQTP